MSMIPSTIRIIALGGLVGGVLANTVFAQKTVRLDGVPEEFTLPFFVPV